MTSVCAGLVRRTARCADADQRLHTVRPLLEVMIAHFDSIFHKRWKLLDEELAIGYAGFRERLELE